MQDLWGGRGRACWGRYPLRSYSCHPPAVTHRPFHSAAGCQTQPFCSVLGRWQRKRSGMAGPPMRQDSRKFFENLSGAGKSIAVLTSGGDAQGNDAQAEFHHRTAAIALSVLAKLMTRFCCGLTNYTFFNPLWASSTSFSTVILILKIFTDENNQVHWCGSPSFIWKWHPCSSEFGHFHLLMLVWWNRDWIHSYFRGNVTDRHSSSDNRRSCRVVCEGALLCVL